MMAECSCSYINITYVDLQCMFMPMEDHWRRSREGPDWIMVTRTCMCEEEEDDYPVFVREIHSPLSITSASVFRVFN